MTDRLIKTVEDYLLFARCASPGRGHARALLLFRRRQLAEWRRRRPEGAGALPPRSREHWRRASGFRLFAANQLQKGTPRKGQMPERGVIEMKPVADDAWLKARSVGHQVFRDLPAGDRHQPARFPHHRRGAKWSCRQARGLPPCQGRRIVLGAGLHAPQVSGARRPRVRRVPEARTHAIRGAARAQGLGGSSPPTPATPWSGWRRSGSYRGWRASSRRSKTRSA